VTRGPLARRAPALVLATRNLRRNRLWSLLSTLGIAIGVLAIASLAILGNVLQLAAADSLGGLGNQVLVTPNQEAGVESIDERTVAEIRRASGDRATVVPLVTGSGTVQGNRGRSFAQLYGMREPGRLFAARDGELPDRHRQGVILGPGIADDVGAGVGSTVTVDGNDYRVVAVLADQDSFTPVRPERAVILPPDEFVDDSYSQVVVEAESGPAASAAAARIRERVNARQERVSVLEFSSIVAEIDRFFGLLSAFLTGLGAISLVVAGVSILNIMLVTTVERREEIGVMRAVGIGKRDVLTLMLAEAAVLGLIGAVLGVVLTLLVVAGLYIASPIGLDVILAPSNGAYLLGAAVVGVAVSLASGLYPAYRAANERPVEALRG
jgi:putative ABC transport system permease protein